MLKIFVIIKNFIIIEEYKYKDLLEASRYSYDEKIIEEYINKGYDVNERDCYGTQPIHNASNISRDFKTLKLLLDHGADINSVDGMGRTPLNIAAGKTNMAYTIKKLLEYGADVNIKSKYGYLPIHNACNTASNIDHVKLLLDAGSDIEAVDESGRRPIHYAVYGTNTSKLSLLIKRDAKVNVTDFKGKTPLHYAADNRFHSDALHILIMKGANVNIKDIYGKTPLHYACEEYNNYISVNYLMMNNADANVVDNNNLTPLEYCITDGLYVPASIIYYLILKTSNCPEMIKDPIFIKNMNAANKKYATKKLRMRCEKDISNMKSTKINSKYTIDTLLTSENNILLMSLIDNLKEDLAISKLFPVYSRILKKRIEFIRRISLIVKSSLHTLDYSSLAYLPLEIRYKILSLVNNNDLVSICRCLGKNNELDFDIEDYNKLL